MVEERMITILIMICGKSGSEMKIEIVILTLMLFLS